MPKSPKVLPKPAGPFRQAAKRFLQETFARVRDRAERAGLTLDEVPEKLLSAASIPILVGGEAGEQPA